MKVIFPVLASVVLLLFPFSAFAEKKLNFASIEGSSYRESLLRKVKLAYICAGYDVTATKYPFKRALQSANQGIEDGDLGRLVVPVTYSNLIKIDVPLDFVTVHIIKRSSDPANYVLKDIMHRRVGIILGHQSAESLVSSFTDVTRVDNGKQLFQMLNAKRIDFAITTKKGAGLFLEQAGLDTELAVLEPPVKKTAFYHYLHVKHQAIVPMVEQCFRETVASESWYK